MAVASAWGCDRLLETETIALEIFPVEVLITAPTGTNLGGIPVTFSDNDRLITNEQGRLRVNYQGAVGGALDIAVHLPDELRADSPARQTFTLQRSEEGKPAPIRFVVLVTSKAGPPTETPAEDQTRYVVVVDTDCPQQPVEVDGESLGSTDEDGYLEQHFLRDPGGYARIVAKSKGRCPQVVCSFVLPEAGAILKVEPGCNEAANTARTGIAAGPNAAASAAGALALNATDTTDRGSEGRTGGKVDADSSKKKRKSRKKRKRSARKRRKRKSAKTTKVAAADRQEEGAMPVAETALTLMPQDEAESAPVALEPDPPLFAPKKRQPSARITRAPDDPERLAQRQRRARARERRLRAQEQRRARERQLRAQEERRAQERALQAEEERRARERELRALRAEEERRDRERALRAEEQRRAEAERERERLAQERRAQAERERQLRASAAARPATDPVVPDLEDEDAPIRIESPPARAPAARPASADPRVPVSTLQSDRGLAPSAPAVEATAAASADSTANGAPLAEPVRPSDGRRARVSCTPPGLDLYVDGQLALRDCGERSVVYLSPGVRKLTLSGPECAETQPVFTEIGQRGSIKPIEVAGGCRSRCAESVRRALASTPKLDEGVLSCLKEVQAGQSNYLEARLLLAHVYARSGRPQQAERALAEALKTRRGRSDPELRARLAELLGRRGQLEEASGEAEAAWRYRMKFRGGRAARVQWILNTLKLRAGFFEQLFYAEEEVAFYDKAIATYNDLEKTARQSRNRNMVSYARAARDRVRVQRRRLDGE